MGENAAVIQSAYDAFARGDVGVVIGLVDDDAEWTSPETLPQGGKFRHRDGVGEFFQGIGAAWSALSLEVESLSEADNGLVIGVVRASGTRQDGTSGGYGAVHVFTVRAGKIVRFREYTDLDAALT